MKPINNDNASCNPISSNCVIWQGPDIPCINLCKGDTVSDVIAKLATELCDVLTQIDVTTLDLSCFNLTGCDPKDLQAFLQFLIDKICALENCCATSNSGRAATTCPDCVVNIARCFYYQDQYGNQITTMQLSDYVTAIGNKVCDILAQIDIINQTLVNYNIRITALENKPDPTLTIPTVTPTCVLPSTPTEVQVVVQALEQQFCDLESSTGMPVDIYTAISKQCINGSDKALGPGGGTMGSIPGWVSSVTNLADSITNMWLTICDMRAAVQYIKTNCCPSGCDGIELTLSAVTVAPANVRIYINGIIPASFAQCSGLGTLFTISDSLGGSITAYIDVIANLNNLAGVLIDLSGTPVNPSSNLTVSAVICLKDNVTGTTCSYTTSYFINNEASCPIVTLSTTSNSIGYSYTVISGSGIYTVQLYDNAGTTLIAQNVNAVTGPATITGVFTGLASSTIYKTRVLITVGDSTTTCPFTPATTLPGLCPPPTSVSASIVVI